MFTGIVEETGIVTAIKKERANLHISISPSFIKEIKIDQSIAHNGVCLTVVEKKKNYFTVTAIAETLAKSNLKFVKEGDKINLERCMKADGRFDGHIVQGHVDCTGELKRVEETHGSWVYEFEIEGEQKKDSFRLIVEKGSITINGVSLTVVDVRKPSAKKGTRFTVAIIPYTYENTNFHALKKGDHVNIEFDIIGKYISRMMEVYRRG